MDTYEDGAVLRLQNNKPSDWEDEESLKYHLKQWDTPKQSTRHFKAFVQSALSKANRIVDLGCGAGAATAYMASKNPQTQFLGVDYSLKLVSNAKRLSEERLLSNVSFTCDDWLALKNLYSDFDAAISLQTLSWLPEFEEPLRQIFSKIRPKWVAVTSLFYEGDISCRIQVHEHKGNRKQFYNVYSLPEVNRFAAGYGYRIVKFAPFAIDVDIPKPVDPDRMGTYTVLTSTQVQSRPTRLQLSGPLLMNWYSLMLAKASW